MEPDYARARAAATDLLLKQSIRSLKVDVTKLRFAHSIRFDTVQRFCVITATSVENLDAGSGCLRDGCTIIYENGDAKTYIVLYDQKQNYRRQSFTLAHEVGHILLGHRSDGDMQEAEANCFAGQLLAPMVLVHALAERQNWPLEASDICGVFSISAQAAENRLRELARVSGFNECDIMLLNKFSHMLCRKDEPIVEY